MITKGAGSTVTKNRRSNTTRILVSFLILILAVTSIVSAVAPEQVTGLANTSDCRSVTWSWTNPTDGDFNGTEIWRDGAFVGNLDNTTESTKWSSLSPGGTYELGITSFNLTGEANATYTNQTVVLPACPNPVACSTTGILGGLSLAGIMLMGLGAVMIIIPFKGTGAMGRGGVGGKEMGGLPGWTVMGVITICLGGVLLLISYIILAPMFTVAGC